MVSDTANVALKARMIALGGYDIRGTRQQDLVVQKLSNSTTLAKKTEVNIPPANRCQIPRRTCRVALILRPSWNSACWTPAFIVMAGVRT